MNQSFLEKKQASDAYWLMLENFQSTAPEQVVKIAQAHGKSMAEVEADLKIVHKLPR